MPIVRDQALVGILTRSDVLDAILDFSAKLPENETERLPPARGVRDGVKANW